MTWRGQSKKRRAVVLEHLVAAAKVALAGSVAAYTEAIKVLEREGAPVKGYPRVFAEQLVIVEGRGRFPLEQLARDSACPRGESDALMMYRELPSSPEGRLLIRRVVLRRFVCSGRGTPYTERWRSFGWVVRWFGPPDRLWEGEMKLDRDDDAAGRPRALR